MNVIHTNARQQKTQRRRAGKREAILDAAASILARGEELTMKGLAAECEASVGAVYRYFPGKHALETGLQVRAIRALELHLERRLAGVRDPLGRIEVAARSWSTFADAHPTLFRLVDGSLSDPERVLSDDEIALVDAALEPVLERLAELLAVAVECGLLRDGDPRLRTHALWAAVHGAGHFRKRRTEPTGAQVESELIRALLAGLKA